MANVDEPLTFWTFLRKTLRTTGALLTSIFSIPATVCSIYFPTAPLKFIFAILVVCSIVWACFQVWRDSLLSAQKIIDGRDVEIKTLKHRDYDVQHLESTKRKVNALTDGGKDLVHFLLHNGEIETEDLRKRCQNPTYFDEALARPQNELLIVAEARGIVGRSGVHYFWKVNPKFEVVLEDVDLNGKREPRLFL